MRGKREGTIYKRKDGLWCGQVTIGRDLKTGKLKRKTIYGKTRNEVAEKITANLQKLNTGTYIEPSNVTLKNWLNRWLKGRKPHISYNSWRNYDIMLRRHIIPELGNKKLKDVTTRDIQDLLNYKLEHGNVKSGGPLSVRSVKYIYQTLHIALKQAVKERLLVFNAAEAVELPKRKTIKEMKTYNANQVQAFLNKARETDEFYYTAFYLELSTGLRMGELLGLMWKDINFKDKIIKIRRQLQREPGGLIIKTLKTKSSRRNIPIDPNVVKVLKSHKISQTKNKLYLGTAYNDNNLVFCLENGKPKDLKNFFSKFKAIIKEAGLPNIRFHDLRHTYATLSLEAGVPAKTLQEILGHSSISTTLDTYSHVTDNMLIDAAKKISQVLEGKA